MTKKNRNNSITVQIVVFTLAKFQLIQNLYKCVGYEWKHCFVSIVKTVMEYKMISIKIK